MRSTMMTLANWISSFLMLKNFLRIVGSSNSMTVVLTSTRELEDGVWVVVGGGDAGATVRQAERLARVRFDF